MSSGSPGTNPLAVENLRREAAARGVAPERLVFAQRMERLEEHLARHRLADLFLDTFHYNAHATANHALWAGLPVLTRPGETFASRVGASLLQAVGLPELIAGSTQEYEAMALDLATHPEKLRALRDRLAAQRTTSALFDTPRFTRHLEDGYTQIWIRYQSGLLPTDIRVVASREPAVVPGLPEVPAPELFARAVAAQQAGSLEAAAELYRAVLAAEAGHPPTLSNLSVILKDLNQLPAALASVDRAIVAAPDFADAWYNRGLILIELQRLEEALASYDRAVALKPDYADAWYNRGLVLSALKKPAAAVASFDRVIALDPDYAKAYSSKGVALHELSRPDEALAACDRAIAINPDDSGAHYNRGKVLQGLKRWDEAAASYECAVGIEPGRFNAEAMAQHCRMLVCNWDDYDRLTYKLLGQINMGELVAAPFPILAFPASPGLLQHCAVAFAKARLPEQPLPLVRSVRPPREKIRLGYFSADFYNHPVGLLTAELFERHDRSRFEVIGFSCYPSPDDAVHRRLRTAFDRFVPVSGQSDAEAARLVRELEIDIAIDLGGHTENSGVGIFAHRPAPVQLHYLGFAGTLGLPYIDYLVADPVVIPEQQRRHYTEKIIYLPDSYMTGDSRLRIADRAFTRAEFGLPAEGFVFCCFNNSYKITPDLFAIWMRLLARVEGSVLWISGTNPLAEENLRREAAARGVAPARLVFSERMVRLEDHLARHRLADLFLDTFHYNAHATANHALWAGLPVLTCPGETFASRVGASLLNAVGLPELIAGSHQEYEALALDLATDPEKLRALRDRLAGQRLSSPLFDTPRFVRHLEEGYTQIWERQRAGLPPADIRVVTAPRHLEERSPGR